MTRKTTMTAVLAVLAIAVGGIGVATAQGQAQGNTPVAEMAGIITFNTQAKAVGAIPETYWVPNGYKLELTLDLNVFGPGSASFATPPVEFPKGEPPQFHVKRVSDTRIVLTEINNNQKPGTEERYFFKARIVFEGETYKSPDPTLINVGPPGT